MTQRLSELLQQEKGYLTDTCLSAQDQYEKLVSYFFPELTQSGPGMNHPQ